jgi:NitT/TauT family transport system substrate-binding protein
MIETQTRAPERRAMVPSSRSSLFLLTLLCIAPLALGCHSSSDPAATNSAASTTPDSQGTKVKVAYIGLTCEAAMFVAKEKGFFEEEGLDVEFVKTDWDGLRDGLGLGRFDANYTLIMYLLKPIEQGLDVKITGGIHAGCLRVQTDVDSEIKTAADLKGKKIGIPTMGSPPFLFTCRALKAAGLDPTADVEWVAVGADVMALALENGQVDAVANSEPIGSILEAQGKIKTIVDQAVDAPYKDEYCCATVVSGKFAKHDPAGAAKVTRALMKGARWVHENPAAAARLSVESKYIASSVELNAVAIAKLHYMPGVDRCRESVGLAAAEMKVAGLLNPSTDPAELAERAWLSLEGVSDQWIQELNVEKVAESRWAPRGDEKLHAQLTEALLAGKIQTCCDDFCFGQ